MMLLLRGEGVLEKIAAGEGFACSLSEDKGWPTDDLVGEETEGRSP